MKLRLLIFSLVLLAVCGCRQRWFETNNQNPYPAVPVANGPVTDKQTLPNPLTVPVVDQDFVWAQLTDEIDDYFKIRREERTRVVDNVMTDGWIETYPTVGSTLPEAWRQDSTRGFERLHATLQTVRRWARIRVIPTPGASHIDVQVFKELEDLQYPQHSHVGDPSFAQTQSPQLNTIRDQFAPEQYGWIPMGRDTSLEQRILARLQSRLTQPTPAPKPARFQFIHGLLRK